LEAVLPGIDLFRQEWATYRIDRAERAMPRGGRPDTATIVSEGNVISAWPTKLALVPQLARMVEACLPASQAGEFDLDALKNWPRPQVAQPPWELPRIWHRLDGAKPSREAA
jgi:hypothetical protein